MKAPPRTSTIAERAMDSAATRERVVAETAMILLDKNLIDRRAKKLPVVIVELSQALGVPVRALQEAYWRLEDNRTTTAQMMGDADSALASVY